MKKYLVKIWETEEERDLGISDIIYTNIESIKEAIKKAKEYYNENNCASLEVQREGDYQTIYFKDNQEEKYFYNISENNYKDKIKNIVETYFCENDISNLMDFGADRDSLVMPSISEVYKELMGKLGINYENIYTEDVSDGKYTTIIEFNDDNKIQIDTSAWNKEEVIINNLNSVYEVYENNLEDDMEM